jgi:glycosyltransferase involved in cell wall biosynthesis
MSSDPLISVVIPAYGTRETIEQSIDSVLVQTYPHYEIIVVDDGSPDNISSLIETSYGKKVILIRQDNLGLAGARNTGIKHAKGAYIAFLDSDDVWLPDKLTTQAEQIKNSPNTDVFYGDCYFWDGNTQSGLWTELHQQKDGLVPKELIERTVMIPVLTAVVKAEALREVGGFDKTLRRVEDYDLWLRLAVAGKIFTASPEPLALYRINPKGLSSNVLAQAVTQLEVYQKLIHNPLAQPFASQIKSQIRIFRHEILHLKRASYIQDNKRLRAVLLKLRMASLNPVKSMKQLVSNHTRA